jgi:hypothetical protein
MSKSREIHSLTEYSTLNKFDNLFPICYIIGVTEVAHRMERLIFYQKAPLPLFHFLMKILEKGLIIEKYV